MAKRADRTGLKQTPAESKYRRILREHTKGTTLKELAGRHGVATSTLKWWKSQLRSRDRARAEARRSSLRKEQQGSVLVPVQVAPPARARSSFEVRVRGDRVVRLEKGFDAEELARLVTVLEQTGC